MKLRCIKAENDDLNVWKFTEGKEYKLHCRWEDDPHIFDDNGIELWLFLYEHVIRGAGVDNFHFEVVK